MKPRRPCLDDKQTNAAMRIRRVWVCLRCDNTKVAKNAIANKCFGPVDYIVIAISGGRCRDARQIAASAGLCHRDGRNQLPRRATWKKALLLLFRTKRRNVRHHNIRMKPHSEPCVVGARKLLDHEHRMKKVAACSPISRIQPRAQKPRLPGLTPGFPINNAILHPPLLVGLHLPINKTAEGLLEKGVLFAKKATVHGDKTANATAGACHQKTTQQAGGEAGTRTPGVIRR